MSTGQRAPRDSTTGARYGAGIRYDRFDWVLVRAPTLPVEAYAATAHGDTPDLVQWLADPVVRTALDVSSPGLAERLERLSGRDIDSPEGSRLAGTLRRYLVRMSTRPTPFGLFAAVGLGELGPSTSMRLGADGPRTRTRPDMAWLLAFVAALEERTDIRHRLRVAVNAAVWFEGDRALIAERSALVGGGPAGPVSVRATGAVRRALSHGRHGVVWDALAEEVLAAPGASPAKVEQLLTRLWRETFLLTELRPPLTHPAPARYVAERLAGIPSARDEHAALCALITAIDRWDELGWNARPSALRALSEQASSIVPAFDGVPLQTDAALDLAATGLAESVAEESSRAVELLLAVGNPLEAGNLDAYRQAFVERYGADREVPLLEMLDPEHGLGPPSRAMEHRAQVDPARSHAREATLRRIAARALHRRELAVELDDETIGLLSAGDRAAERSPASVDLSVFVLAETAADVDAGAFRLLVGPNLGAQAAGRNAGRFVDMLGERARGAAAAVAAAEIEHRPSALHAELVYLPQRSRSANVAIRPAAYDHEVAVGTSAGVDATRNVPLSELVVGVRDGRLTVRWPPFARDLYVHAGHMLTSREAPVACRFLEDVSRGAQSPLTMFDWGSAAESPFLPRIERGRVILAPARWRVDVATRDEQFPPDDESFHESLAAWRSSWLVPQRVYLAAGDNRLLLDLDSRGHREVLRDELRRLNGQGALLLHEPLPGPEHAWLEGPDGHHLLEVVVPLVRRVAHPPPLAADERSLPPSVDRSDRLRPPGSDWLYVKLYCPRDDQEELLAEELRTFGEFAIGSGLAERWFFVRYADPSPHLRVRFQGEPERLLDGLLPSLCRRWVELIADGTCSTLAFDTYEREIERYGGLAAMEAIEGIFAADSATVAEVLHLLRTDEISLDRLLLAALSVDELLGALGLDVDGRRRHLDAAPNSARHATGRLYRDRKNELRSLLAGTDRDSIAAQEPELAAVLRARSDLIAPLAERMLTLSERGELTKPLDRIWQSVVHVHCNRLLGEGPPTEQEVLGLLQRTHEGLHRAPLR